MSTRTADAYPARGAHVPGDSFSARAKAYFASDWRRAVQTLLGLIWLLDGGLQFQSFMYSHGFIAMILEMTPGQASWISGSITWAAKIAQSDLALFNTLFALTQVAIGFGLLYRRAVKPALAISFAWALIVWWFGEGFGMMFMMMAQPLTGAPGAVLLYALVGMVVWPNRRPGGLLGIRGARAAWCVLWLVMAWLWLEPQSAATNATANVIREAPSGMSWLSTAQFWIAKGAHGNGVAIALVLAAISAAIAVAVAADWRAKGFLIAAIVLNLLFWVFAQGFGGIFEGGATDPNAGIVFVVLALAMWPLAGLRARDRERGRSGGDSRTEAAAAIGELS